MALFATRSLLMAMKRCRADLRSESVYHINFLKMYLLVYNKSILRDFLSFSRCGFARIILKQYIGISTSSGQSCVHQHATWWNVAFYIQFEAIFAADSVYVSSCSTYQNIVQDKIWGWYFKQCFLFRKQFLPILKNILRLHQTNCFNSSQVCSILSIKGKDETRYGFV